MREGGKRGGRRLRPVVRPGPRHHLPRGWTSPVRILEKTAQLAGGLADAETPSILERLSGSAIYPGNRVEIFVHGPRAFAAMLEAVDAAVDEVLLESYIFKDDETGRRFQEALIAAAKRGARVRVLADALGSIGTGGAFWRRLRENGVEARIFHPLLGTLQFMPFRDHRKILVVDRRVAFTGGMNIGDEYGSSLLPSQNIFRDTHARVEGPAAWETAVVFEEGWVRAGGDSLGLPTLTVAEAPGARVLVLDTRPGRGVRELVAVLSALVGASRRRLWISMAYFAPRRRAIAILGSAAARGVDVRLLLPGRSDVELVRHAGHGFYSGLLHRGVRVFEYQAAVLHAKTFVIDGSVSLVGSSNLDMRSFEMNAECNFLIFDAGVGKALEAVFEEDLEQSVEIERAAWRRRPRFHRVADGLARRLAPIL